jgi:peptidoglycan hydrolase-like protein with peptidoglycan-binding domain
MKDLPGASRARIVTISLTALGLMLGLPLGAHAQAAGSATTASNLSPRLLAEASWHGRLIREPLATTTHVATSASRTRPVAYGTGFASTHGSTRVRRLQRGLVRLGYRPGAVDGLFGRRTQAAVLAFQRKHGLARTGAADAATVATLARRIRTRASGMPRASTTLAAAAAPRQSQAPPPTARPAPAAHPVASADTGRGPGLTLVVLVAIGAIVLPLAGVAGRLVALRRHDRRLAERARVVTAPPTHTRERARHHRAALLEHDQWRAPRADRSDAHEGRSDALEPYRDEIAAVATAVAARPPRRPEPTDDARSTRFTRSTPDNGQKPDAAPIVAAEVQDTRRRPSPEQRAALRERIRSMREGGMTLQAIADHLNVEGVRTLSGGTFWRPANVRRAGAPDGSRAGKRRQEPGEGQAGDSS